jgi:hypothetical protein
MAARFDYNNIDVNKVPVKFYEGTVTRSTALSGGLVVDDAMTYSAQISKGDKVIFYSDANSGGEIVMQKVTLGSNEVNDVHGIVIDDPIGSDDVTATSGTPAHAQRRGGTVKMKGVAMTTMDVTDAGAIRAAYSVKYSESADGVIEGSATLANGDAIAAAYTAASGKIPVLEGYHGFHPAD